MSDQGFVLDKRLRIVMKCYISENDVPEDLRKNLANKTDQRISAIFYKIASVLQDLMISMDDDHKKDDDTSQNELRTAPLLFLVYELKEQGHIDFDFG